MLTFKEKYFFVAKKKFIYNIKNLYLKKKHACGRNRGRIVMRHRGGALKKKFFIIDFFKSYLNCYYYILNFKYDPNRSTLISLIAYTSGILSYSIALENTTIMTKLFIGPDALPKNGNITFLKKIAINTKLCLLQSNLHNPIKYIRSNGTYGILSKKSKSGMVIKLPSGIYKIFNIFIFTTIGRIFEFNYLLFRYKKAGYNRLKGFRPTVRGVAMNPIDHPYGGGEGKKSKKSICMSP